MRIIDNCSLLPYNTFGINVCTKRFIEYESVGELLQLLHDWKLAGNPAILNIGKGSNLLFTKDFDGWVLHSAIYGIEIIGSDADTVFVRVGAGQDWDDFVLYAIEHGMYGAENLSWIPGTVGASAVQNIGAYGVEVKDLIVAVELIEIETGEKKVFTNEMCCYAYRQSVFKNELRGKYVVTHVIYRLVRKFSPQIGYGAIHSELLHRSCVIESLSPMELRSVIIAIRQKKLPDPKKIGNAGSFFMNPVVERSIYDRICKAFPEVPHFDMGEYVKIPAGWLIEQCGWKGRNLGHVAVHDKQALVLVNKGGASGQEVVFLCEAICKDVEMRFGIKLRPEVNIL